MQNNVQSNLDYERQVDRAERKRKIKFIVGRVLVLTLLITWAIFTFWPFYWMVVTSFKDTMSINVYPPELWPHNPTLNAYKKIFAEASVWRWTLNSLIISCTQTVTDVILAAMAGYAFSKLKFPGRNKIFWIMLCTMMIPSEVTLIPLYILVINKFNLGNTYAALIIPGMVGIGHIFLMKQYMGGLPGTLIDAARIDGTSEWGIFWKIIMPMSKPGLAVLAIFEFVGTWNSFFWPLLVTNESKMRTIQVGLSSFKFEHMQDYGSIMACSVFAALPMVILFLALQKYFLQGITVGALKG